MTKDDIEYFVKRFPFITNAINNNLMRAVFYIGNRKQVIEITDEVKKIYEILNLIYNIEDDVWVKLMIKFIMHGKSDVYIINRIYGSKNMYYSKKVALMGKIYNCCICLGLVSFKEVLMEKIA